MLLLNPFGLTKQRPFRLCFEVMRLLKQIQVGMPEPDLGSVDFIAVAGDFDTTNLCWRGFSTLRPRTLGKRFGERFLKSGSGFLWALRTCYAFLCSWDGDNHLISLLRCTSADA